MRCFRKLITMTVAMCLLCNFISYANSGATKVGGDDKSAVLQYINDDNVCIKNEWKQLWNNWYYFGEDGKSIQNAWAEIDEKWYYFDNWSIMLHDTVTPDGYSVGSDGAWLVDVPQKTE